MSQIPDRRNSSSVTEEQEIAAHFKELFLCSKLLRKRMKQLAMPASEAQKEPHAQVPLPEYLLSMSAADWIASQENR